MKGSILNYKVFEGVLDSIDLNKKHIINTINAHSYCVAKKDILFKESLLSSDVLLPDGISIVYAHYLLRGEKIRKIAGYDIFLFLMDILNKESESCFFLGSSKKTLKKIKQKASEEYPNIKVFDYSPPFKEEFSKEDNIEMITAINKSRPAVLFVGMTAPKQEKWSYLNKDKINAKLIVSIGAVFDFYAGTVKRPSKFWINIGLEWLIRFLENPKKMFPRIFKSMPIFVRDIMLLKIKQVKA